MRGVPCDDCGLEQLEKFCGLATELASELRLVVLFRGWVGEGGAMETIL